MARIMTRIEIRKPIADILCFSEEETIIMIIQKITLSNGKTILFLGSEVYQRWPDDDEWEKIDSAIFEHTPIPKNAQIEEIMV